MIENTARYPPAVVMGLSPTGLHVVRALGAAGIEVTGIGEGFQAGRFSRYLSRCILTRTAEERLDVLLQLYPEADANGRPVLIPTSDQDVQLVLDHADDLSRRYAFQESYKDGTAARIMSKDSFYELCAESHVEFPPIWKSRREDLLDLLPGVTFPCLIKPARIHDIKNEMRGRKVWIIRDEEEFRREAKSIPPRAGTLLVQQIVPGPESQITLCCVHVDRQGFARQVFTARKLRQFPPGFGSASLVESSPEPETAAVSTELLSSMGYSGIAALEFKRHPQTGKLNIIEINVRPSLWFALSEASGRETVLSAFRELAGHGNAEQERPQIQGVRWRYLSKDIASTLFYRLRPNFVLPPPRVPRGGEVKERVGAVFAQRDPVPVLGELLNTLSKSISRAISVFSLGKNLRS